MVVIFTLAKFLAKCVILARHSFPIICSFSLCNAVMIMYRSSCMSISPVHMSFRSVYEADQAIQIAPYPSLAKRATIPSIED